MLCHLYSFTNNVTANGSDATDSQIYSLIAQLYNYIASQAIPIGS